MNDGFGPDRIFKLSFRYNYLNHLPIAHPETAISGEEPTRPLVFHFGYNKPWESGSLPGTHSFAEPYYALWRVMDERAGLRRRV
jgi:lipopolysaccharide biosynthesis glycosyltransferase